MGNVNPTSWPVAVSATPADTRIVTFVVASRSDASTRPVTKSAIAEFLTRSHDPGELFLDRYRVIHTSGSSGEVGYFVYSPSDWARGTTMRQPRERPVRKGGAKGKFRMAYYAAVDGHYAGVTLISAIKNSPARFFLDLKLFEVNDPLADVLAQLNEFQPEVLVGYTTALKIVPEEPSVLSNLGLSYMLTRELPQAEETLRRAYSNPRADARVRQNLALVVGLQGRFAEAETIAKGDLPADEATANVAYLREMLSRKDKDNSRPPGNRATVPVAALNRPD